MSNPYKTIGMYHQGTIEREREGTIERERENERERERENERDKPFIRLHRQSLIQTGYMPLYRVMTIQRTIPRDDRPSAAWHCQSCTHRPNETAHLR
jgi:hypothetical protein